MSTYYMYTYLQNNERKAYSQEEGIKLVADIDRLINEAKNQLVYLCHSNDVELFLHHKSDESTVYYSLYRINELIRMAVISKDYINDICFYSVPSGLVLSPQGIQKLEEFGNKECLLQYLKDNSSKFRPTQDNSYYPLSQLSLYYDINLGHTTKGVGVVNINIASLIESLRVKPQHLFLLQDKQIIYPSDMANSQLPKEIPYNELIKNGLALKENRAYVLIKSKEFDYSMVAEINIPLTIDSLNGIRLFMITFILMMSVITSLLCFYISVKIFRPISGILDLLEKNKTLLIGDKQLLQAENEIKYIEASIERTISNTADMNKELKERVHRLKKAQTVALQSQINPHFLNNTLETINWIAVSQLGSKNAITEITDSLSGMLRTALQDTDTIISVSKEIEHTKMYIRIMERRYPNKFDVIWDIPEEVLNCQTIKIILQPLIENAIYHGIKKLNEKGNIQISGTINQSMVTLSVQDNGLGMEPSIVAQLNAQLSVDNIKEDAHIGLSNVNQRIKLYFGDEYGVWVQSDNLFGTRVTIRFPKI